MARHRLTAAARRQIDPEPRMSAAEIKGEIAAAYARLREPVELETDDCDPLAALLAGRSDVERVIELRDADAAHRAERGM